MLTPEARRARHVSYNNRHTNTIVLLTFHKAVLLMLCIEGKNVYAFSFFFPLGLVTLLQQLAVSLNATALRSHSPEADALSRCYATY